MRMRSNIPQRTRRPALCRIGPPNRLFIAGRLYRRGHPVLRILHLHHAQSPKLPALYHLFCLPHQRIAGVVMRQAKDQPAFLDDPRQRHRIFHRRGQRLVADHMDSRFQERLRRSEMQVIGRNDRHRIDPVRPLRFRRRHFRKTSISPLRRDVHLQRRRSAPLGIRRQRPRH